MNLEVRTKSTVEEGITHREDLDVGRTFISYAPGNGSQYNLLFTNVTSFGPGARDLLGIRAGWLVTLTNADPRPSILISETKEKLYWGYILTHLGRSIGKADAVVLAELIGYFTGRPYVTSEEILAEEEQAQAAG